MTDTPRGGARPGAGRPPSQTRLTIEELFNKLNISPAEELVRLATHPDTSVEMKISVFKDLLNYQYAKKKQVTHEVTTPGELVEFMKAVADQGRPSPPTARKKK